MREQVGVLGAGASGLSFALLHDADIQIIESADQPGGHSRSRSIDGWVFDRGPHIIFSRNQLLLDCIVSSLGSNVHQCRRNNKVSILGALAKYPIENDLAALPHPLRGDAVLSFLAARGSDHQIDNLAEWFTAAFGEVLTSLYFRPYNEKVWNVPLEELSMSWSDRIPQAPIEDVIRGALGESTEGYLHQLFYSYPLCGGYNAIMDAWAAGIDSAQMSLGFNVEAILPSDGGVRVVTTKDDRTFDRVVSTIPIKHLVHLVSDVPDPVAAAVGRLVVNPMIVATYGFEGIDPNQYTAVYVADQQFAVNRISYPAVFSPNNAPEGCFSVQAEITAPPGSEIMNWSNEQVRNHVIEGLASRDLIPSEGPHVFEAIERFESAYVVYTQGFEADVAIAREWFAEQGIHLHGRFGSHQYVNIDGCLDQSIALARLLGTDVSDDEILGRFTSLS